MDKEEKEDLNENNRNIKKENFNFNHDGYENNNTNNNDHKKEKGEKIGINKKNHLQNGYFISIIIMKNTKYDLSKRISSNKMKRSKEHIIVIPIGRERTDDFKERDRAIVMDKTTITMHAHDVEFITIKEEKYTNQYIQKHGNNAKKEQDKPHKE